jgi:hypothetical protein
VTGAGFALLGLPGDGGTYVTTVLPGVLLLGLGLTATVAPLTSAVLGSVDRERSGLASGVNNAVARASGLLAVAVAGLVMVGSFRGGLEGRLVSAQVPESARTMMMSGADRLAALTPPPTLDGAARAGAERAVRLAALDAFRLVALSCAVLAALAALVAALTLRSGRMEGGN